MNDGNGPIAPMATPRYALDGTAAVYDYGTLEQFWVAEKPLLRSREPEAVLLLLGMGGERQELSSAQLIS
jgi:hypothetical protein